MAELVRAQMEALGFHEVRVDEWGNVVGTIRGRGRSSVLFDAHMDTVPADPPAWKHPPYAAVVEDGRLYGRGASDMKGALAAAVYGVGLLAQTGDDFGTVHVCASVAEEAVEGPALERVLERLRPECVVIMESTGLDIAIGQRGRAELTIETLGRSAHTSNPALGINAVEKMTAVIRALAGLDMPTDPFLGPAVAVVTDIASEPFPGLSVVPHRCVITVDRRMVVGEEPAGVVGQIQTLLDRLAAADPEFRGTVSIAEDRLTTYTGREIVAPNFAPAWRIDSEHPLVTKARAALWDVGQEPRLVTYRFCTNGSGSMGRMGIPTIGYGPGREEVAHAADEYVELEELYRACEGYAALAARLSRL